MSLSPKIISVFCLVQFFFVVAGYLFTQSCLKLYDVAGERGLLIVSPTLALFVRVYGLYFLLVPLVLAGLSAMQGRAVRGIAFIPAWQLIVGSVVTAGVAAVFSLGAYQAMMALR